MHNIKFVKMTGSGNDFVLIDNRQLQYSLDWVILAPEICNRRFGIGADGLIILEKSTKSDFKMCYFNADGSDGGMCGNGGRCTALFVMDNLASQNVKFEALDFIYSAERTSDLKIKLKMKDPNSLRLNLVISLFNENVTAHFIDTGAPHTIFFINDLPNSVKSELNDIGIRKIGSMIRDHNLFAPAGTNVNFVDVIDNNNISIRTYERGVEDETHACGTGAIASSVIASLIKNIGSSIDVKTRSGESLTVQFDWNGYKVENVVLIGNAKKVFEGTYEI